MALAFLVTVAAPADPQRLTVTATDAAVGQAIHATAELSESPEASGEISFEVFGPGDQECSEPALSPTPESTSVAGEGAYESGEVTPPTAGVYYWTAHYSGDTGNPPADSTCLAISTVAKAIPELTGNASGSVVGSAIHDEATLTGGFSPTGEVTFSVYGPTDTGCLAPLETASVALQDNHATSADFLPQQAGEFRWTVEYPGDANNEAVSLDCGAVNQGSTVDKAAPTLVGVATSAAKAGLTITDNVTLAEGFGPGGQLVFRAYGPGDSSCTGDVKYEASVPVSDNGPYSPAGFAPGAGSYRWTVDYAGDTNNEATLLGCGAEHQSSTVGKASPTLAGVATTPVKVGQTITDSVTLAAGFAASGQLHFRAYGPGDSSCAGPVAYEASVPLSGNGNGTYAPPGFAPGAGLYLWTVDYAGDADNEAVSLACGAANQASTVDKAAPTLVGVATSAAKAGLSITDSATLAQGFDASGQLHFRAYGPGDSSCTGPVAYEASVALSGNGNGTYAPPGFAPGAGLYLWTVDYAGDADNEAVSLACGAEPSQASAVGQIPVTVAVNATGGTVGNPVIATATIQEGATPTGQITFKAFSPGDTACSGTVAFSSTVSVSGNGQYHSGAFAPSRVGAFRWTVAYSGDANHLPVVAGCGKATSSLAQAAPSVAGAVKQRVTVGTSFQDAATLQGGYLPGGTITFRIYGPVAAGCAKPAFIDTVAIAGNGTFNSDPFAAPRPGRYSFVASYSGDAANKGATEPCDSASQIVVVQKRAPKVKPRARLIEGRRISIRAHLSGGASPSGTITFRLYGPGDKRCKHKPAFSGGTTVKSNGNFPLAQYLAPKSGVYRLSVGYSGDERNWRYTATCNNAQAVRVG